ncbi:hypothetical protein E2C01_050897 [Portunus trituberculatus]|uniref:Uncharacterized protein n=1 Tax=Portunus trituberculatus TaxID=210409 RepID=A0A5B7GHB3_PORTR|nr:hypothetical protein [Portunus trituberculatus]
MHPFLPISFPFPPLPINPSSNPNNQNNHDVYSEASMEATVTSSPRESNDLAGRSLNPTLTPRRLPPSLLPPQTSSTAHHETPATIYNMLHRVPRVGDGGSSVR